MDHAVACAPESPAPPDFTGRGMPAPRGFGSQLGAAPPGFPLAPGRAATATAPPSASRFLRVVTSPREWLIGVPRPGVRASAAALAAAAEFLDLPETGHQGPQVAFIRTGAALAPAEFRLVLHHCNGRVSVYCPADQLSGYCAAALSVAATGAAAAFEREHGADLLSAAVALVPHAELPGTVHPAAAVTAPGAVVLAACSNLITAELAGAVTETWTAHLRFGAGLTGAPESA